MPSFHDLNLPADLTDAVDDLGFTTPTPIQERAIPALLAGHDVVGVAQTGTGKTAAFALPLLAAITPRGGVQALVLAPTRELALQSAQAVSDLAARSRHVETVAVYGGSPYGPQLRALKKGAQVVVGTPGRVIDLINKGALDLSGVNFFVLDEADEMLRMGFAEDVEIIAQSVPRDRTTALFSATMPEQIARVAEKHLTDPVSIQVARQSSTVETVHQTYAVVPFKYKSIALSRVLACRKADAVIVFVRTRADAEDVHISLTRAGFASAAISGDVAQRERERIVERLREGDLDVLVATDVAARGLDVERIGLVVNYDVPREDEAYVHRIGRTGRAGREGTSLTFFTPRENRRLRQIEKLTGAKMEEVELPGPDQVREQRCREILAQAHESSNRGLNAKMRDSLVAFAEENDLDPLALAGAVIASAAGPLVTESSAKRGGGKTRREESVDEDGNFLGANFENGRDGGSSLKGRRAGGSRHDRSLGGGVRYRVEVGKRDGVKPGWIVGAIANEGGIAGKNVGRIEIFPSFSLVEITGGLSADSARRVARAKVQGRPLKIREDMGPGKFRHGNRR